MGVAIQRDFVATSRGQLHVLKAGGGRPVVLMQTIPFSANIYRPLMAILGERYACYGLDIMGYGDSDARTERWLIEDYAANIAEALDVLGLTDVLLVTGHMTAMIGVELALTRPDLVNRLSIDGVSAVSREEAQAWLASAKPIPAWAADTAAIDHWWTTIHALFMKLNPTFDIAAADRRMVAGYFSAHLLMNMGPSPWDAAMTYDMRENLPKVTQPVLMITSSTDTQRGHHERNLAALQNGRAHDFAGVNPIYQFDRPERAGEYAVALERFWAD